MHGIRCGNLGVEKVLAGAAVVMIVGKIVSRLYILKPKKAASSGMQSSICIALLEVYRHQKATFEFPDWLVYTHRCHHKMKKTSLLAAKETTASFSPSSSNILPIANLHQLPILRPDIIRKSLGLLVIMMAVIMVRMGVVRGAYVFHLVDAAAFGASFDGAVAGCLFCKGFFQLRFTMGRDGGMGLLGEVFWVCVVYVGGGRNER